MKDLEEDNTKQNHTMSIFKAYDIRGVYDADLTEDIAYRIGYFIPSLLNTGKILVGRDMRVSSPALFTALCQGIN
ncbi:MAG: phosphomannomutase/phosphoglucomutase, partial [Bacteroidota bacterium]|nr:phosphomannomutase/phosphoglucomutase [Bacteroidota bacterium]